jgi:hydrogenase maturation protease
MGSGTLILGLGNPLRGDDGLGPRVIVELRRRGLPEGVTATDAGTAGLDLLRYLEGWGRVVVVDAVDVGREPGQFVRFTPSEARFLRSEGGLSIHDHGLGEAIALASALGRRLPELVVYGLQPMDMAWREGLSPQVEASVPALVEAVLTEVTGDDDAKDTGD